MFTASLKRWLTILIALLALTFAVGCGRPVTVDGDGDGDSDGDSDGDGDADGDGDGDGDGDVDGDADGDADGDGDGDGDADPPPTCECPEPFSACAPIPEVAFSAWDESLAEQILQAIACATATLDIAVYDISAPCFVDAILAATASNPDLQVRIVTEFDTCGRVDGELICELSRLEDAGVAEVVIDNRASYLMHDKFVIVDGVRAVVTTANWTDAGVCEEYNAGFLIEDGTLVSALRTEFERFFLDQNFGAPNVEEPITSGGTELYFSPSGVDWQEELVRRINAADDEIRFLMFAFTREDLAQALVDAASRGVSVRGVISPRFFTRAYDAVPLMVESGLDIRVADVHHKTTLISGGEDGVVVTGSGNLSTAAREHNNELVFFIEGDADLWDAFDAEFEAVWAIAEVESLD